MHVRGSCFLDGFTWLLVASMCARWLVATARIIMFAFVCICASCEPAQVCLRYSITCSSLTCCIFAAWLWRHARTCSTWPTVQALLMGRFLSWCTLGTCRRLLPEPQGRVNMSQQVHLPNFPAGLFPLSWTCLNLRTQPSILPFFCG